MAKRERKAWLVVGPRGGVVGIEWHRVDAAISVVGWGERIVRCTITWDDGKTKPDKKKKRNG